MVTCRGKNLTGNVYILENFENFGPGTVTNRKNHKKSKKKSKKNPEKIEKIRKKSGKLGKLGKKSEKIGKKYLFLGSESKRKKSISGPEWKKIDFSARN